MAKLDRVAELYGRWLLLKFVLTAATVALILVACGVIGLIKGCG